MSEFSKLLGKAKDNTAGILKKDAFANLKKTVADVSSAATVGEGASTLDHPPGPEAPSPKPSGFTFDLSGKKKSPSVKERKDALLLPGVVPSGTEAHLGAVDSMMEATAPSFSETDAAKEFQSADQPDKFNAAHVEALKTSISVLYNSIDNKELVTNALSHIMSHLKKHPFLVDIMLPEDCQMMVRGLQASYGVTIAKKQTKRKKRDAGRQDVDAVLDQIADLDIKI